MFAVVANSQRKDLALSIDAMAASFLGVTGKPKSWIDERSGIALAGCARGIQTEDRYDTQPYVNDQICFVADGYLYDRAAVARLAGMTGSELCLLSDAEILFRCYQLYGEDLPAKVYGDYAFAALHRDSREVFISDNHVGTRAVYYTLLGGTLICASQMVAVLAHPAVRRTPNLVALPLLVAPKVLDRETSVEGVEKLPGGNLLCFSPQREPFFSKWWHPDEIEPARFQKVEDCVQQARDVFVRAIASAVTSDTGVCTTLSGGLDSTLMAAFAARELGVRGQTLPAYTSVPEDGLNSEATPDWEHDESHLAALLVSQNDNMGLHLVRPEGRCCVEIMPDIHRTSCTASRNISNQLWGLRMAALTRAAGRRVLLTGGRGNATASLEGRNVISVLFGTGHWLTAMRLAHRDHRLGGSVPAWKALALELRLIHQQLRESRPRVRAGARFLSAFFLERNKSLLNQAVGEMRNRQQHIDFATMSSRFSGADTMHISGVESRDPFTNRHFIELVLSFPLEAFLAGGRARGLAREMGAGLVPDAIRLRRKRGAQTPEAAGLIQKHAATYRNAFSLLRASDQCRELFDLDDAGTVLENLIAGEGNLGQAYSIDRLLDVGTLIQEWGF